MNRFYKQVTAVLLASFMTLPAFACTKGKDNSKIDLTNSAVSTDKEGMVHIDLTLTPDPEVNVTTTPAVTTFVDENGDIFVNKTDINGTTVTESGGAPVTEAYTGTTLATSYAEKDYTPKNKSYQAMWLDMSKKADFVFDGEFLIFDAKISEDAKDGVYPIDVFHPDFANYDAKTLPVTTNIGYVCVNANAPNVKKNIGDGLTVSCNTVTAKPGDTVQLVFVLDNNPGFVGFNFMFSYDGNAMTVSGGGAGKDFSSRANLTAHEVKN